MQRALSSTTLIKEKTQDEQLNKQFSGLALKGFKEAAETRLKEFKLAAFVAAICGIFPGKEGNADQDQKVIQKFTEKFNYSPVTYEFEKQKDGDQQDAIRKESKSEEQTVVVTATLSCLREIKNVKKEIPLLTSRVSLSFPKSVIDSMRVASPKACSPLVPESLLNLLQTHDKADICLQLLSLFNPGDGKKELSTYLKENSYFIDPVLTGRCRTINQKNTYEVKMGEVCITTAESGIDHEYAQNSAYTKILKYIRYSLTPKNKMERYIRMIACNMAKNKLLTWESWQQVTTEAVFSQLYQTLEDINERGELTNSRFVECLANIGIKVSADPLGVKPGIKVSPALSLSSPSLPFFDELRNKLSLGMASRGHSISKISPSSSSGAQDEKSMKDSPSQLSRTGSESEGNQDELSESRNVDAEMTSEMGPADSVADSLAPEEDANPGIRLGGVTSLSSFAFKFLPRVTSSSDCPVSPDSRGSASASLSDTTSEANKASQAGAADATGIDSLSAQAQLLNVEEDLQNGRMSADWTRPHIF